MARRNAFLHVGLPRSGGAFLDAALVEHAEALAEVGVKHPAISAEEMFRAAIEIRRDHQAWGYQRREVEGAWAEICRRAHKGKSDAVFSQELLAGCTPDQIDLLLDGLAGFKVHVVITVRDPGALVAAASGGQDLAEVAARWSAGIRAPQRTHVLVVPSEADPRGPIWLGFGEIAGFDASRLPLPEPGLPAHVRRSLTQAVDGAGGDQDLLVLAERWRKALAEGGYDVHGDTADLLPPASDGSALPVALDEEPWLTTDVLANVLAEVARLRAHNHALEERNEKLEKKRQKLKRKLADA